MLQVDLYFIEPNNRRFKSLSRNPVIQEIFMWMSTEEQVTAMMNASRDERPALEYVIEGIELHFQPSDLFDLMLIHRHRQILGSIARYIMEHNGYHKLTVKKMRKGSFIQSAAVYRKVY